MNLMDDADLAGDNTDRFEADAVAFYSGQAKSRALIPAGFCHYCGERVVHGMLFCDITDNDCAKDWEHEQQRRKANGQ